MESEIFENVDPVPISISSVSLTSEPANGFFVSTGGKSTLHSLVGGATVTVYDAFTHEDLGIAEDHALSASHVLSDGRLLFAVEGEPHIYISKEPAGREIYIRQDTELGTSLSEQIDALYMRYDGRVFFSTAGTTTIFRSDRDGTRMPFADASVLGVTGHDITALSPKTALPTSM